MKEKDGHLIYSYYLVTHDIIMLSMVYILLQLKNSALKVKTINVALNPIKLNKRLIFRSDYILSIISMAVRFAMKYICVYNNVLNG
jgi:hypothetical protein